MHSIYATFTGVQTPKRKETQRGEERLHLGSLFEEMKPIMVGRGWEEAASWWQEQVAHICHILGEQEAENQEEADQGYKLQGPPHSDPLLATLYLAKQLQSKCAATGGCGNRSLHKL